MHSAYSKKLTMLQIEGAIQAGVFTGPVVLEEIALPRFFVRFTTKGGKIRLLRFDCSDYDLQPIEVEPVDPTTRGPLTRDQWMKRDGGAFPEHELKKMPFLCISGTRDYYTFFGHRPSVTGERWEKLRDGLQVRELVGTIAGNFSSGKWE